MPDDGAPEADPRERGGPVPAPAGRLEPAPATSLLDPRSLQILSAEHSSLLSARALAYNEAFTRGAMFLAFLSMSFVGIALVAQAIAIDRDLLLVTALVLGFDLVVGLTTYGRIVRANYEDYIAVQGMARIRHGYGEIAPVVLPYFTSSVHDDLTGVMVTYGSPPTAGAGAVAYQLATSPTMIGLIVSMIGGVLALVLTLIAGAPVQLAFGVAVVALLAIFVVLAALTVRFYLGVQARLPVRFPTPAGDANDTPGGNG